MSGKPAGKQTSDGWTLTVNRPSYGLLSTPHSERQRCETSSTGNVVVKRTESSDQVVLVTSTGGVGRSRLLGRGCGSSGVGEKYVVMLTNTNTDFG